MFFLSCRRSFFILKAQLSIINLKNNFKRITLVNKGYSERVTIDTNLTFIDENQELNFGEIAIIEVKQSKSSQKSELTSFLKKHKMEH